MATSSSRMCPGSGKPCSPRPWPEASAALSSGSSLLRIGLGYPDKTEELAILDRFQQSDPLAVLEPVTRPEELVELQRMRGAIRVSSAVREYIIDLAGATRSHKALRFGVSPRGTLGLLRAGQALAVLRQRDYVLPDDIKYLAHPVLAHRLIFKEEERLRGTSYSFLSFRWIHDWLASGPDVVTWSSVLLQAMLAIGFWWGGRYLIQGQARLQSHYARLDFGLAAFFVLFFVKFILWHKSGIEVEDFLSEKLLGSYLVFGLLAVGTARHQGTIQAQFISGRKIIGMTISAAIVVVLFSIGLLAFFLPYMTAAAEFGYTALKTVGAPLGAALLAVLRFMFTSRQVDQELTTPSRKPVAAGSDAAATESSWWIDLIEKIAGHVAVGIGGLLLLAAVVVLAWLLVRWLWRRTPEEADRRRGFDLAALYAWLKSGSRQVASLWGWVSKIFSRSPRTGASFFVALLRWGRRSGMPVRTGETPLEYGRRLKAGFPMVEAEIGTIVDLFNQEKYREQVLDIRRLDSADAAWRELRSPLRWGRRLRTWFLQKEDRDDRIHLR